MNRSTLNVMSKLIGFVFPLLHIMLVAILFGVVGYLCAIFITILSAMAVLKAMGMMIALSYQSILILIGLCAISRGILRYIEQASNHYIAFKLLAMLRHQIFIKLRTLAPAKLEGKDKGNLISLITSDIELLEVFYAHTISPIFIAIIVSIIMSCFIGYYHIALGILAAVIYLMIGLLLPFVFGRKGKDTGQLYRDHYGQMNGFILDSLQGVKESVQYEHAKVRLEEMNQKMISIEKEQTILKKVEAKNFATSDTFVLMGAFLVTVLGIMLYQSQAIHFTGLVITTIAMISSFGPVVAISNLSNNLHHTIASGNRVIDLLEEKPLLKEVEDGQSITYGDIECHNIQFSYQEEAIIKDFNMSLPKNTIIGIHGKSGTGKSTLLKLMMRFFKPQTGSILINNHSLEEINTEGLRDMEAYVIQETYLFNDTLANNIALAKPDATLQEIKLAAKKASIDDFIESLPDGYQSKAGELGSLLSEGQKQRIGIARAFLNQAEIILLDEPTSNLDSLNEAIILKSLKEDSKNKTIILVSHRESTMSIVEQTYFMNSKRLT